MEKVDDDGKAQTIVCNHGEKAVLTIFKVIVLIAITFFMAYVACGVCRHFCVFFLQRTQASLLKKERAEKQTRVKLILDLGLQC